MQTRPLGKTGLSVSILGAGTWALASNSWRDGDSRAAQRVLYQAIEHGVDLVDTALVYGRGDSERLVGEVVQDLRGRDRVVIATKVVPVETGQPFGVEVTAEPISTPGSKHSAPAPRSLHQSLPAAYVVQCVEQSLRNLRLDAIPLVQLHGWHDAWLESSAWPELRGTLERCVHAGKVLHWGISVDPHGAPAAAVVADPLIAAVQLPYSLLDRRAEAELLPAAAAAGTAVLLRAPLDSGALTGLYVVDTIFAVGDWRARRFRPERLVDLAPRLDRLRAIVRESDGEVESLVELALRFALAQPQGSALLVGMRQPAHLLANLAIAERPRLSPALLARLDEETRPPVIAGDDDENDR